MRALLLACLFVAASCTDECSPGDQKELFTCQYENPFSASRECVDYLGVWDEALRTQYCDTVFTGVKGVVAPGKCDTAGSFGNCLVDKGGGKSVQIYYFGGDQTVTKNMCETYLMGKWNGEGGTNPDNLMDEALAAMKSNADVVVAPECADSECIEQLAAQRQWIAFTPRALAPTVGLVFYPGGNVDPRAYAPEAQSFALSGLQTIIVPMPGNLALGGYERMNDVVAAYPAVTAWFLAGHSLGGAMAVHYLAEFPGKASGLILWAAYADPSDDIHAQVLPVMSLRGSFDGLTTADEVEAGRPYLPADTRYAVITGGNHGQFGYYGDQAGDQPAGIPRSLQHELAVAATLYLVHGGGGAGAIDPAFAAADLAEQDFCRQAQLQIANAGDALSADDITEQSHEQVNEFIKSKPSIAGGKLTVQRYLRQAGNPSVLIAPPLHTGEVWCKQKTQAAIVPTGGSGPEGTCADINQATVAWALAQVTEQQRARYLAEGPKLTYAADADFATGAEWANSSQTVLEDAGGGTFALRSPRLRTTDDPSIPEEYRQVYYCKVWAPARAIKWVLAFE